MHALTWLNELRELAEMEAIEGLPWESRASIQREYQEVRSYLGYHYDLMLTEDGWIGEKKANWRETCIECGSIYVIDGQRCACCADGL